MIDLVKTMLDYIYSIDRSKVIMSNTPYKLPPNEEEEFREYLDNSYISVIDSAVTWEDIINYKQEILLHPETIEVLHPDKYEETLDRLSNIPDMPGMAMRDAMQGIQLEDENESQ